MPKHALQDAIAKNKLFNPGTRELVLYLAQKQNKRSRPRRACVPSPKRACACNSYVIRSEVVPALLYSITPDTLFSDLISTVQSSVSACVSCVPVTRVDGTCDVCHRQSDRDHRMNCKTPELILQLSRAIIASSFQRLILPVLATVLG